MNKWQPIKTAPHDRVPVLVYDGGYLDGSDQVVFTATHEGWWKRPGGYLCEPTHWMPLPEPPQEEDEL